MRGRCHEVGDQLRGVLAVGVEDDHGIRIGAQRGLDPGGHRGALAVVAAEAHDLHARVARGVLEEGGDLGRGPVVHQDESSTWRSVSAVTAATRSEW